MVAVSVDVSPELLAVGLRTRLRQNRDIAVVDGASEGDVVVTDAPSQNCSMSQLWAVHEPPSARSLQEALLSGGASGVILYERDLDSWVLAVAAVADGGTWLDPCEGIAEEIVLAAFGSHAQGGGQVGLTRQELRVLRQLSAGSTNADIGEALGLRSSTVKSHLSNAFRKLGAYDREDAVHRARAAGVLD